MHSLCISKFVRIREVLIKFEMKPVTTPCSKTYFENFKFPELTETIINLETVNPIEFFGVNNGKLDILKKKFPLLKILSRGTQIKLSGAPEQVETAKEKIDLLLQYLERNGSLTENYFNQILGGDDLLVLCEADMSNCTRLCEAAIPRSPGSYDLDECQLTRVDGGFAVHVVYHWRQCLG